MIISYHSVKQSLAEGDEEKRLHWKDYIALFIAALEVYSFPLIVLVVVVLVIVFLGRLL